MPVIAIIAFVICVVLFMFLTNILANRKQIKAAYRYGKSNFDIEIPTSASNKNRAFHKLSDAEAFYVLITPYVKDLNDKKKKALQSKIEDMKSDLKIAPAIYEEFMSAVENKDT